MITSIMRRLGAASPRPWSRAPSSPWPFARHDHHDDDASAWGHAHAPEPQELAGPGGWQRGLSAIVAVGLRPCSGAILVLVFSLAQGLFWAGVVSDLHHGARHRDHGGGDRQHRDRRQGLGRPLRRDALRVRHARHARHRGRRAVLIIAFGALLLTGYMVNERLIGCRRQAPVHGSVSAKRDSSALVLRWDHQREESNVERSQRVHEDCRRRWRRVAGAALAASPAAAQTAVPGQFKGDQGAGVRCVRDAVRRLFGHGVV